MSLYILSIDSGATNSNWKFMNELGSSETIRYPGFNLSTNNLDAFNFDIPEKYLGKISHVFFFGAGTGSKEREDLLRDKLAKVLQCQPAIKIGSDLWTAAIALSDGQRCVISILGTGSNCCVFNGTKVEQNINNLGFILGDEGSGYQIGRSILRDYFYNRMPDVDAHLFKEKYQLDRNQLIRNVYHSEVQPNRYIASFCNFTTLCSKEYRQRKADAAISSFFTEQLKQFQGTEDIAHHFSGSIAWHFQEEIKRLSLKYAFNLGKIIQNPLDSLTYKKISQFI